MDEMWLDIDNTSGRYQISSCGRLRKMINGEYVEVKPKIDRYGYLYAVIKYDNQRKTKHVAIHRLVASAFISNPYNLPVVHHIDDDKQNNSSTNLLWCTHGQNNSFSLSARNGKATRNRVIEQYDTKGNLIAIFPTFKAAADSIGAKHNSSLISKCCRSVQGRKSAYGFVWRFGVGDPMFKVSIEGIPSEYLELFVKAYYQAPNAVKELLTNIIGETI